jgi:hypothetical protein
MIAPQIRESLTLFNNLFNDEVCMSTFDKLRSVELADETKRRINNPVFSLGEEAFMEFGYQRKHIRLGNGAIVSIQGSPSHYSTPQTNLDHLTDFIHLEMMMIDGYELLDCSALELENDFDPVTHVVAYVPLADVISFIDNNGGIA